MTNKAEEFFNVDDPESGIHRELAPGLNAQVFVGDNSMLSLVRFVPGGKGEIHSHSEEQWGLLLEGSGTRIQNGVEHQVIAGDFWRTPGGITHGFIAGPQGAKVMDIFSPAREAYREQGEGFANK